MEIADNAVRALRPAHGGLAALAMLTACLAAPLGAQSVDGSSWSYDHDMRLTYEVDDNVAELIDDPVTPRRFTLDVPRTREAIQFFISLRAQYGVVPTEAETSRGAAYLSWF